MFDKFKDMIEMKKHAEEIQRQLEGELIEVNERGLKITINGAQYFQNIEIDQNSLKPENKQKFDGELLRALNGAIKKSQVKAAEKMKTMMPSGFPGL